MTGPGTRVRPETSIGDGVQSVRFYVTRTSHTAHTIYTCSHVTRRVTTAARRLLDDFLQSINHAQPACWTGCAPNLQPSRMRNGQLRCGHRLCVRVCSSVPLLPTHTKSCITRPVSQATVVRHVCLGATTEGGGKASAASRRRQTVSLSGVVRRSAAARRARLAGSSSSL